MEREAFEEKLKEWLLFLEVEKNVSPHTLDAYTSDMHQLLSFWQRIITEEPSIPHAFDQIIRRYVVALFYKKTAKTTLARKLSCLRSFHRYLGTQGIHFTLNIKSPRPEKKLPIILSVDEIFYLLDSVKNKDLPTKFPFRDRAIFELLYATGVRCAELVNISLEDIDFAEKTIRVLGKGRKTRLVLFGSKAHDVLNQYLTVERSQIVDDEQAHLFLNARGGQLTSRSVQRIIEMFRRFLKIDRTLTPHKVRHSFATHLLNQGVDLRILMELLGHKTVATTEIYTHVSSADLAQMFDEKHPLSMLPGEDEEES